MDLDKYNQIKGYTHWKEKLEAGDRAIACIRHKTDGSKNIHNANVIVINNIIKEYENLIVPKTIATKKIRL